MTNRWGFLFAVLVAVVALAGLWIAFERPAASPATNRPSNATISETTTIQIFFTNEKFDPGIIECNRTYPVERVVPQTSAVGRAALNELLKGPTEGERAAGYFTSINDGVRVNSLTIQDGVARADFDARMEEGMGGSCRVAAVRSQIMNTLQQFPTVRDVVISVEGRTEDILQP